LLSSRPPDQAQCGRILFFLQHTFSRGEEAWLIGKIASILCASKKSLAQLVFQRDGIFF
jgi:hypothetical protein